MKQKQNWIAEEETKEKSLGETHIAKKTNAYSDQKKQVTKALLKKCPNPTTMNKYKIFIEVFTNVIGLTVKKTNFSQIDTKIINQQFCLTKEELMIFWSAFSDGQKHKEM